MSGVGIGSFFFIAAAAAGFSPAQVPGLTVWLDIDFGITGDPVTTWLDRSGNNNHLTNDIATGPAIVPSWRNGKAALQGASGVGLRRATFTGGAITQPSVQYIVCEWSPSASHSGIITDGVTSGLRNIARGLGGKMGAFAGINVNFGTAVTLSEPMILKIVFDGASGYIERLEANGTNEGGTINPGTLSLSGLGILSDLGSGAGEFNGKISEVLVYSQIPNSTQDALVISYLRTKYNI